MINAKNKLLELLKTLGCSENYVDFQTIPTSPPGSYSSTVIVHFPDGYVVEGFSENKRQTAAEIAAAQVVLDLIAKDRPKLLAVNWEDIYLDAQAGDALIKLSVYLSSQSKNSHDKSKQLQHFESDSNLAKIFDRWKAQNDPELAIWGTNLGEKRKATLVEALLWQRFNKQVLTIEAPVKLEVLFSTLQ